MPIWRLQTAISGDTVFPRDKVVMTPHFNDATGLSGPQDLCNDLADAVSNWMTPPNARQVEVTAYDAQGTVPVAPQGYAIRNTGAIPAALMPREIACCLSFYSVQNRPRYRGRVYVPVFCSLSTASLAGRPALAYRNNVGALATIFADLGGPDVDWSVFSRALDEANPVSNWWVDDEWDTIRSRGLRATTRTVGTVNE